ncbi:MAG: hypothetical protein ACRBBW_07775 [Cellvibrionaceae bacterium]
MSVIPSTQLRLARESRQFKRLVDEQQWERLLKQDGELMAAVSDAADDPERELGALLLEMKAVVANYRSLLDSCSQQVERYVVGDARA